MNSFFLFLKFLFIHLFLAVLGLCCFAQAFSSCDRRGIVFCCGAPASRCSGFSRCRTWAPGTQASVVEVHGLNCPAACEVFLHQGSNPCHVACIGRWILIHCDTSEVPKQFLTGVLVLVSPWEFFSRTVIQKLFSEDWGIMSCK